MIIISLQELTPEVRDRAERLLHLCEHQSLHVRVFETFRSPERQAQLYAQGRAGDTRARVTKSKPGMSWHQWRRALDLVFEGEDPYGEHHPWADLGLAGVAAGLQWGGPWGDRPHFDLPGEVALSVRTAALNRGLRLRAWSPLPHEPTARLQNYLTRLGWDLGAVDGLYGPRTGLIVRKFQETRSLNPSGIADLPTIEALELALVQLREKGGR